MTDSIIVKEITFTDILGEDSGLIPDYSIRILRIDGIYFYRFIQCIPLGCKITDYIGFLPIEKQLTIYLRVNKEMKQLRESDQ